MTQLTDFLDKFLAPATASHAKFYPRGPFVSISLAQTIIESAWGQHTAGTNNYWGIKANAAQIAAGSYTTLMTHETLNGQYVKIPQHFANYPSLEAGFDAHAYLLTTSHYQRCIDARTPDEYARALFACGYATGIPGRRYDDVLIRVMIDDNLYAHDLPPPKVETVVSDKPKLPPRGYYWAMIGANWEPVFVSGPDSVYDFEGTNLVSPTTSPQWRLTLGPSIPTPTPTTTPTPN